MGKGDIKTRKGKLFNKSYGNKRMRKPEINSVLKEKTISVQINPPKVKMQICYNCGKSFEEKDITSEHIPAKFLFEGYDERYKVNRITVPGCSKCNGQYSPTDEEFRNMIGVIAKNKANNKITEKSFRSIARKDAEGKRLVFDNLNKLSGVVFNNIPIEKFHKKNFKGLFYLQYGTVLTDDYELFVNIDENDWSEQTLGMLGYLKDLFAWKHSGHPDILKYVIQPFRLGITNPAKQDLKPENSENMYIGYFDYNKEHAALVMAIRKGYIEEIKQRRISVKQ
jgi:ribosomal small subunit protein bTHX